MKEEVKADPELGAAFNGQTARDMKDYAAALTAYSRPEDRAASMMAGYDAHLSKPVDLHELIATVARLRARRR